MKKTLMRFLLLLWGMMAMSLQAYAAGEVALAVHATSSPSVVEVEVQLNCPATANYTAFQLDLSLPEGFSYEEGSFSKEMRLGGHTAAVAPVGVRGLRVVAYSAGNTAIAGTSGALFRFRMKAAEEVPSGNYTLAAGQSLFACRDGAEEALPAAQVRFDYVSGVAPQEYTVVYRVDGREYRRQQVAEGSAIPAVEGPVKEGHTFLGWDELPETMPGRDITVDALFEVNVYEAVFWLDGKEYSRIQVKYGEKIMPPEVEDTDEYRFEGWEDLPETMPARDIAVHGRRVATGIESLSADTLVEVYTLSGVKLLSGIPCSQLSRRLPKGIYVVNGRVVALRGVR